MKFAIITLLITKYWTTVSLWYGMQLSRIGKKDLTIFDKIIIFPITLLQKIFKIGR